MYNLVVKFKIANSDSEIQAQFPVSNKMASIFNPKILAHFYITDFITDDGDDVTIISMYIIPMDDNE